MTLESHSNLLEWLYMTPSLVIITLCDYFHRMTLKFDYLHLLEWMTTFNLECTLWLTLTC